MKWVLNDEGEMVVVGGRMRREVEEGPFVLVISKRAGYRPYNSKEKLNMRICNGDRTGSGIEGKEGSGE